jgi:high-affinity iron transporter
MLTTFVITLREGIEAFLIVAITLAYLKKTGRDHLVPAAWVGTALALVASVGAGVLFAQAQNKPLWEGTLALVASALVASMVAYMMRAAKHLQQDIASRVDAAAERSAGWAKLGVLLFVLVMITREGMEAALLLDTLLFQNGEYRLAAGALLGVAGAGVLAWLWARHGHRINLRRFFQVTSMFLLLFSVQLAIYAFHELTEANVLPIDNMYWHIATEPYGPEGRYGEWLTYGLVLVPAGWLLLSGWRLRAAARQGG